MTKCTDKHCYCALNIVIASHPSGGVAILTFSVILTRQEYGCVAAIVNSKDLTPISSEDNFQNNFYLFFGKNGRAVFTVRKGNDFLHVKSRHAKM